MTEMETTNNLPKGVFWMRSNMRAAMDFLLVLLVHTEER